MLALATLCNARIQPFPLSAVKLGEDTFQARHFSYNIKYLLEVLDPDRLLWTFRQNAGLPTPGEPYEVSCRKQ